MKNLRTHSSSKQTWLTLALCVSASALLAAETLPALGGLDPVALTQGSEVKGNEDLQVTQGRYRYRFANEANKKKFETAPDKFGIQFDGHCMKMGPLSGRGSPDRYFVAQGCIYLFASDGCREGFKSDPAAFTDCADAPPTGTPADKTRGRKLIELALAGFGGADKVDSLKNILWETTTVYEKQGEKTESRQTVTVVLPDKLRQDYSYGDFKEGHAVADGNAVEIKAKSEVNLLPADIYAFLRRNLYRQPLALLRARNQPDFVAFAADSGEINGQKVEWLNAGYAGATTKLGIDPKTGRILAVVYRGRAPSKLGEVCKAFSDFEVMEGGVTMPRQWEVTFNGKPSTGPKPASRSVALNVPVDGELFPRAN